MQSSKLKSAVCMQSLSHSNLSSRCGTARIPHKHNCLLGTMISNEMRLHHHCNLSGKINTRECVPVPRTFILGTVLFFCIFFWIFKYILFFFWRTRCVFAYKLCVLYFFYKGTLWIFNGGQGICSRTFDASKETFRNSSFIFHFFPYYFSLIKIRKYKSPFSMTFWCYYSKCVFVCIHL